MEENKSLESILTQTLTEALGDKKTGSETEKLDPLGDKISSVELIRVSGSDLDVVNAARVSYGKVSKEITERDSKLIEFLMNHEHTSPFEHNQLSFRIKAPIFVARQWFRHRMNSYNEISYRYVKADMKEFYIPNIWRFQDKVNKQSSSGSFEREDLKAKFKESIASTMKVYEELLAEGVCREQARALLPVSTYTEFIFTCNLHSLMHFAKLRLSPDAQFEIRVYAQALLRLAIQYFPVSLKAFCAKVGITDEGHFDINKN